MGCAFHRPKGERSESESEPGGICFAFHGPRGQKEETQNLKSCGSREQGAGSGERGEGLPVRSTYRSERSQETGDAAEPR